MSVLAGLHGVVAGLLICSLLFVDEAGIPLPIAPSEGLLLLVGLLVSTGAFPLAVIFPLAYLAMGLGMVTGYGWARTVGASGLQAMAEHLSATELFERAQARLKGASPWGIGLVRMVPGLRPYATLAAGAAEVDVRTFVIGALPALLLWEVVLVTAGILVGLPLAHFLGRLEQLAVRGILLVALGAVAWFAVRDASADRRGGIARVTPRLRAALALVVDAAIVLSVVTGLFAIARRVEGLAAGAWLEVLVAAVALMALLIVGRRSQTPGEALFDTSYWHQPAPAVQ